MLTVKQFRTFMFFWSVCFFVVGLLFVIAPQHIIDLLNFVINLVGITDEFPPHSNYLWLALSGSMMITIAYLSYQSGINPRNKPLVYALLICKFMSSFFFVLFAFQTANICYALGAIVDFPIFLSILFFYKKIGVKLKNEASI